VRVFRTGMLTSKSAEELTRRIDKVVNEFMDLNREDSLLEIQHRVGYSFLVAMRPWLMPSFTRLLRRESVPGLSPEFWGRRNAIWYCPQALCDRDD